MTCDGQASKAADRKAGSNVRVTTNKDDKTVATAVESGKAYSGGRRIRKAQSGNGPQCVVVKGDTAWAGRRSAHGSGSAAVIFEGSTMTIQDRLKDQPLLNGRHKYNLALAGLCFPQKAGLSKTKGTIKGMERM
jgi:hypothetical protein